MTKINSAFPGSQSLTYTYDTMNRLTQVMNGPAQVESFSYFDADGNISSRNYPGNLVGYSYTSGTNRLYAVYLNGIEKRYGHDYRGNVTYDAGNNIGSIVYDYRNLPLSIYKNTSLAGTYRYSDHGERIYKESGGKKEYYLRDDKGLELGVYDAASDKLSPINLYGASGQIGRIEVNWTSQWDEDLGEYIDTRTDRRIYFIKDHLGSIRQSIDVSGNMVTASDYYAFGQTKSYWITGTTTDKYRYTGKERDQETGLDYFGAMYYDTITDKWLSVDPLSDNYPGWSPYNYCLNNPLKFIDPDGKGPGDIFRTKRDAANDWGRLNNRISIKNDYEYGSLIYRIN